MPKRRMTPARRLQIRQWQIMGSRARNPLSFRWDRSRYSGKNMLLFHRTTSYRARKIVGTRNWKTSPLQTPYVNLSSGGPTREEHIKGRAVLQVVVPRKKVHYQFHPYVDVGYHIVNRRDLFGRKVKRVM